MRRLRLPSALPEFKGPWLVLVKFVWLALLALALIGTTFGTWAIGTSMRNSYLLWAELGLRPSPGEEQRVMVHPLGTAARQVGIAPNSLLLSVNGASVTWRDADDVLEQAGASPVLRLASPGGAPRLLRLARDPRNASAWEPGLPVSYASFQNISLASAFAINIAFLGVAILLFRRRPGTR